METPTTTTNSNAAQWARKRARLEQQSRRNWCVLAVTCTVSCVGLLVAVLPVLRGPLRDFWPAKHTDIVLIAGLGGMIVLFVLYLTLQQFRVIKMRTEVSHIETEAGEKSKRSVARLHALLNVTRLMGAVSSPLRLFQGITTTCLDVFDCQQASLMLLNDDQESLVMKAAAGHTDGGKLFAVNQPVDQGIAGYVARTGESLLLGDDFDRERFPGLSADVRGLHAAMVVPITVRDETVGVLSIGSRAAGAVYTEDDLQALRVFAINAGTFIHQSERNEWMHQTIQRYRDREDQTTPQ